MTQFSKATLYSEYPRKITQPSSSNGMHGRHDIAIGGNNLPSKDGRQSKQQSGSEKNLDQLVQNASAFAQQAGQKLSFSIVQKLNRTIVTVIDEESGKVIRQIPMEEMLALADLLSDVQAPGENNLLKGLFFDQDT